MKRRVVWTLTVLSLGLLLPHCGGDDKDSGYISGGESGGTGGASGASGASGAAGSSGSAGIGGTGAQGGTGGTGGAGGTGVSGEGGAAGTGGGTPCQQRCAAAASLACPGDGTCEQDCLAALNFAPWCNDIGTTFVSCAAQRPASDWFCDGTGRSSLQEGICKTEAQASVMCLMHGPPEGMPDLSAECTAACAAMAGLPCTPANCEQSCNDSIANGPCAGAVGLVTVCGATLSVGDYECVQNVPVPTGERCKDRISLLVACFQSQG